MNSWQFRHLRSPFAAVLFVLLIGVAVVRFWNVQETAASDQQLNPRPELLVSAEWLTRNLNTDSLRIIDMRGPSDYAAGHVPGAVNVPGGALYAERNGVPGMLPDAGQLQALFRNAGISADTTVVAYDGGNGLLAARMFMALDVMGQGNGRVLDGGWSAWQSGGNPVSQQAVRPPPTSIVLKPRNDAVVDLEWVRSHIGDEATAFVDARSRAEYVGERSGSKRHGRIPGAVNLEWSEHLSAEAGGRMRDPKELAALYAKLGVDPGQTVATYCQSETRGAHTYFTLKWLGYPDVRAYDGSWHEWGNRDDTPIETGDPGTGARAAPGGEIQARMPSGAEEVGELAINQDQARLLLGEPDQIDVQNPCWGRQATWTFSGRREEGPVRLVFLDGVLKEIIR